MSGAHRDALLGRYPRAHGAPIHLVDPAGLGIGDLSRPDWGNTVTIRYGKVGAAKGRTQVKSFESAEKAQSFAEKQIGKKTGKGYGETDRPE